MSLIKTNDHHEINSMKNKKSQHPPAGKEWTTRTGFSTQEIQLAGEIWLEGNPLLIGSELAGWYRSLAQEDRLESGP